MKNTSSIHKLLSGRTITLYTRYGRKILVTGKLPDTIIVKIYRRPKLDEYPEYEEIMKVNPNRMTVDDVKKKINQILKQKGDEIIR